MRRVVIVLVMATSAWLAQTNASGIHPPDTASAAPTTTPPTTTATPARGDPVFGFASGNVGSGGVSAGAGTVSDGLGLGVEAPSLPRPGEEGKGQSCLYIPAYSDEYGPPSYFAPQQDLATGVAGQYYDVYCGGQWTQLLFVPAEPAAPAGAPANPTQLAQQALATAPFQPLAITMSPPPGREAVNFPIWLSLSGYAPISASASAGGVTSTVSVVPSTVTWDMGDGHTVTCDGPGVPYDPAVPIAAQEPPPCGYVYQTSSANQPGEAFQVTATVRFNATWTVTGAPGGGSLGPLNRSVSIPVTVGEIEVLNQ